MKNPVVTIHMKKGNTIIIELYPSKAKNTVNNFISLVKKGFYNGTTFHRVISGFMIQGGDPQGTGMGGPGYQIKGEFTSNGYKNDLLHERGVISMARSGHPDSAGSQFFIMHNDSRHLDGQYASFGRLISGLEELDRIAQVNTDRNDKPLVSEIIQKIECDLNGYNFKEPDIRV